MGIHEHVNAVWDRDILGPLQEYITIPNISAAYEDRWEELGHMERAVALVRDWCAQRAIAGMSIDVQRLPGRTPLIVIDIPAFGRAPSDRTVILYGHLDKQPEMTGWREGLGPWTPVIEGNRLYGRGGADDGYAAFASLTAIEAVQANGGTHSRCVVLIEASEESGSPDLPAHLEALARQPEALYAYRAMARVTADLALSGGRIGPAQYADIIATLGPDAPLVAGAHDRPGARTRSARAP